MVFFFFQAEDGIRDLVRSRGLGDVYKRQPERVHEIANPLGAFADLACEVAEQNNPNHPCHYACLLYTSDAADERSSVDLGGRRIIKKKKTDTHSTVGTY